MRHVGTCQPWGLGCFAADATNNGTSRISANAREACDQDLIEMALVYMNKGLACKEKSRPFCVERAACIGPVDKALGSAKDLLTPPPSVLSLAPKSHVHVSKWDVGSRSLS